MSHPFPYRVNVDRTASREAVLRRLEQAGHRSDLVYGGRSSRYLDDLEAIRRRPASINMALPVYVPGSTPEQNERRLRRQGMRYSDLWEAIELAVRQPEIFDPDAPDHSALIIFGAPFEFYDNILGAPFEFHGNNICVPGFGGLSAKPIFEQYRLDEHWGEVRVFASEL